jgi:CRISPR-associated protein Csm2
MRQQQGGQRREQYEERLPNLFLVEIGEVRGNRRHPRDYRLSEDAPYREIITSESPQAAKKLVEWSEHLGKFLAGAEMEGEDERRSKLTTSQIRKVFGEVRRLWMEAQKGWTDVLTRKVHLLIPKLEYAARKEVAVKALRAVLVPSIREVLEGGNHDEIRKRFERFVEFFEAILAYHYAFGGK